MTIVRRIARPLLAAPLIQTGVDVARHPAAQAEAAAPVLSRVSGPLRLPQDPVLVVRASGAVTAAAGTLLALGKLPRISALAIVATAPVVQNTQPFWTEKDKDLRRTQRNAFLRDLGLLGGALLAAVDTEGKPSVAWRGKRAGKKASEAVKGAGDSVADSAKDAQKSTKKALKDAQKSAKKAQKDAVKAAVKQQAKVTKATAKSAAKAQKKADQAAARVKDAAGSARDTLPV